MKNRKMINYIVKLATRFNKSAIYNEFWQTTDSPSTTVVGRMLNDLASEYSDEDKIGMLVDAVTTLFDRFVYQPTYARRVSLDTEQYVYGKFNGDLFLHDLIHEAIDPGISGSFFDQEEDVEYGLENYYSEHATEFIGQKSTEHLTYGIAKYISENLYSFIANDLFDLISPEDLTIDNFQEAILNKINDDASGLKDTYKSINDILIHEVKSLCYLSKTEEPVNFAKNKFIPALGKRIAGKFNSNRNKNVSKNLLSENDLAIGNRVRLFLKYLEDKLVNGQLEKILQ